MTTGKWVFVTTRPKIAYSSTTMVVVQGLPNPGDTTLRKAPVFLLSINPVFSSSPAVTVADQYGNSAVYVGDPGSNRVNKVDGKTGDEIGYVHTAGQVLSSPIVDSGGTVYFGDDQNMYGATNKSTDSFAIKWSYNFTGGVISSPALTNFYGGLVVSTTGSAKLVLFNDTVVHKQYTSRSGRPSGQPTDQPSRQPSRQPTQAPSGTPLIKVCEKKLFCICICRFIFMLNSNFIFMLFVCSPVVSCPNSYRNLTPILLLLLLLQSMTSALNFVAISGPCGVTLDLQGNLYGVNGGFTIIQWRPPLVAQTTGGGGTTFAGGGTTLPTALAAGASAPATSMIFGYTRNIRMDTFGNMYVAGYAQGVVYKIDSTGLCTIVAGQYNVVGSTGDGFPATSAAMSNVEDVAISALNSDVYIAVAGSNRIRKVDGTTQIISTYAGNGLTTGTNNVDATSSGISYPSGVALDANDNLYIADLYNYAIRYVDKATRIITIIAGTMGSSSASGDGGPATSASLATPRGITYDPAGMLWIAGGTSTVRMVDLTTTRNIITTVMTGMSRAINS